MTAENLPDITYLEATVVGQNPYYEEIKHLISEGMYGQPEIESLRYMNTTAWDPLQYTDRNKFCKKYSWSVPDPDSIEFVKRHALGGLIDPIAGTGYWAYVLGQVGVDVVCYDSNVGKDTGHKSDKEWVDIEFGLCSRSVVNHPDRTLFLSWPPYSNDVGENCIKNYTGNRVIYIGEGEGGCCGDDGMFERLAEYWDEVADHQILQWWGMHDHITVYERKAIDA